ncbi:hypothetical protein [Pseudovibrio sp. Tun.PSC04-5.I4]|uniref:hypothetical protein n=1 Tax=Pseudovibrio sp. Tun.PSC04-5.I4 TaxID=1798213 RepID=UPI001356326B|nr:hypothetical protein [Pseudovibrio sp. Tun.PSC04-5.I4]
MLTTLQIFATAYVIIGSITNIFTGQLGAYCRNRGSGQSEDSPEAHSRNKIDEIGDQ